MKLKGITCSLVSLRPSDTEQRNITTTTSRKQQAQGKSTNEKDNTKHASPSLRDARTLSAGCLPVHVVRPIPITLRALSLSCGPLANIPADFALFHCSSLPSLFEPQVLSCRCDLLTRHCVDRTDQLFLDLHPRAFDMPSTAAGTSADSLGIFCTPIGRPDRSTETASVAPVDKLPVKRGFMGPLEMLSEMRAVNSYLQLLGEQLYVFAETSPSAATCASRSPTVTSAWGSGAHGYPAKPGATHAAVSWGGASERDALYLLQTVMENTRRLVIQSQNVVWVLLGRDTATSGATSGQASCGISYSESPSDVAKRGVDGGVSPRDNEEPRMSLMRGMQGSPSRVALVPSLARSEVQVTGRTPVSAFTTQPRLSDGVAEQARRCPWPATQFCYMTHVEFKRGRLRRFLSPVTMKAGTYVIVPGDRGYDCGLVVQCALWNPHKQAYDVDTIQSLDPGVLPPGNAGSIMEVIRVATDEEVHRLHREHVSMERLALTTCRDIADRLRLSMEVLDCEYQYDGTKISFFFDSAEVIDFRELNKELFRVFNARIWMQNTNTAVRNEAPRKVEPSRRGHRLRVGFRGTS